MPRNPLLLIIECSTAAILNGMGRNGEILKSMLNVGANRSIGDEAKGFDLMRPESLMIHWHHWGLPEGPGNPKRVLKQRRK